jgi:hypothetical protein
MNLIYKNSCAVSLNDFKGLKILDEINDSITNEDIPKEIPIITIDKIDSNSFFEKYYSTDPPSYSNLFGIRPRE